MPASSSAPTWSGVPIGGWGCGRPTGTPTSVASTVPDAAFDPSVRNVYKVLLTRGMQSVRIDSTDPETLELPARPGARMTLAGGHGH